MTIDQLAAMIQEGFKSTASKEDLKAVNARLDGIDSRLDGIDGRLDRIEHQILADYGRRIESLEQELKRLKDALAV